MKQRLDLAELIGSLIDHIEKHTDFKCYDAPDNKESPFFSIELQDTNQQNDCKDAFVDCVQVSIHCISEAPVGYYSNAPVLEMVRCLEVAMEEPIVLPEPFDLYRIEHDGLQTLKRDPSGEGHAIEVYRFFVCYDK